MEHVIHHKLCFLANLIDNNFENVGSTFCPFCRVTYCPSCSKLYACLDLTPRLTA